MQAAPEPLPVEGAVEITVSEVLTPGPQFKPQDPGEKAEYGGICF